MHFPRYPPASVDESIIYGKAIPRPDSSSLKSCSTIITNFSASTLHRVLSPQMELESDVCLDSDQWRSMKSPPQGERLPIQAWQGSLQIVASHRCQLAPLKRRVGTANDIREGKLAADRSPGCLG